MLPKKVLRILELVDNNKEEAQENCDIVQSYEKKETVVIKDYTRITPYYPNYPYYGNGLVLTNTTDFAHTGGNILNINSTK